MNQGHGGKPTSPVTTIQSLVKKSFGQKFTQMTAQYWLIAGILLCGMGLEGLRAEFVKQWRESDIDRPVLLYLPGPVAGYDPASCEPGETQKCGKDVGECRLGKYTCELGRFGGCIGEVLPAQEVCDGKDNNCNGVVDEQCPELGVEM